MTMGRLIVADALKKQFPKDSDWDYPVNTNSYVCEVIDNAPTVDAVEVVRCKNCKHYHSALCYCALKESGYWQPDDYCSSGRRESG